MISVIIASVNPVHLEHLRRNIGETIGVPFEIIAFENGNAARGICEIYNSGARQARYDVLCFMHEDVLMKTPDWGRVIAKLFSNNDVGAVGVAGCSYKSLAPSGWVAYGLPQILHYHVEQSYKFMDKPTELLLSNPNGVKSQEVAVIDGVWMCTKKDIVLQHPFDEDLLRGFHGYDVDFSITVAQRYKVLVTYEVLLNHFSEGNFGADWLAAILKVAEKWRPLLPLNKAALTRRQAEMVEVRTCKNLIGLMKRFKYSVSQKLSVVWSLKNAISLPSLIKLTFYALK
ncbi:MAG TPA: hypothetical protein ENO28_07705 [Bacteroidetes bacterium]|nr:hypothetical protein [Bacteroidota bacterium]